MGGDFFILMAKRFEEEGLRRATGTVHYLTDFVGGEQLAEELSFAI